MRLVEVVAGAQTSPEVVQVARATGEAMGKHVVEAADIPGFLVNRLNRPFFLESLRLCEERCAEVSEIDGLLRGIGFPMGPFELMDLIGIETNHAVAEGFYRQTYGEPRYRPSTLAARKIMAGELGRKTGRGWYVYDGNAGTPAPEEPLELSGGHGAGRRVIVHGELAVLTQLREALSEAGFDVLDDDVADAWLLIEARDTVAPPPPADVPRVRFLHCGSLHQLDPVAAGVHVVAPLAAVDTIETTATPATDPRAIERLEELVAALGRRTQRVGDAPGLVTGRVVAQLVNEAAFLIGDGQWIRAGRRRRVAARRQPPARAREMGAGAGPRARRPRARRAAPRARRRALPRRPFAAPAPCR